MPAQAAPSQRSLQLDRALGDRHPRAHHALHLPRGRAGALQDRRRLTSSSAASGSRSHGQLRHPADDRRLGGGDARRAGDRACRSRWPARSCSPSWRRRRCAPCSSPPSSCSPGIPSVVYGFMGVVLLVPWIREHLGGPGSSVLAGSVILGIMILPTIIGISIDALEAVPRSLPRGLARARRHRVADHPHRVVLPAARSGIVAAVILGMGRAVGETMAVIMVAGNSVRVPHSLARPGAHAHRQHRARDGLRLGRSRAGAVRDGDRAVRDHHGPERAGQPGAPPAHARTPPTGVAAGARCSRARAAVRDAPSSAAARAPPRARLVAAALAQTHGASRCCGLLTGVTVGILLFIIGFVLRRGLPEVTGELPHRGAARHGPRRAASCR